MIRHGCPTCGSGKTEEEMQEALEILQHHMEDETATAFDKMMSDLASAVIKWAMGKPNEFDKIINGMKKQKETDDHICKGV